MNRKNRLFAGTSRHVAALSLLATLVLGACGDDDDSATTSATATATGTATATVTDAPGASTSNGEQTPTDGTECESVDSVSVVLQWVAQSQFAGYFAAKDKGFYEAQCLDVTIQEGGVNIVPQQVLASGNSEFAVSQVIKSMASREEGADLVNIAQVFQRGDDLQVSWADSGITTLEDLRGKRVGSWGFGNELLIYSAMRSVGIEPDVDVTIVQQPFDMSLLLNREVDVAQAKAYNEYAQLLEATNPDTGELYTPEDFSLIDLPALGFGQLEDGVYARAEWLADEKNEVIATRFLAATFQGWAFCRDSFDECVDIVLDNGSTLGRGHMTWQLNEINQLIWPSADGIGAMDTAEWDKTIDVGMEGAVLTVVPEDGAYRTDLSERARELLAASGLDLDGADFEPQTVELTPGGE